MGSESQQHKLDRVRRPRVQITYDVETNGAMEKKELPFVVGVLADLSGAPKTALKALKDSKIPVELNFKHIDDFEPAKIAAQVPTLKALLDLRERLTYLQAKMEGND